jgi:hypothetical protein
MFSGCPSQSVQAQNFSRIQAAWKLGEFGTFRAMETAVVLYHDPRLKIDWNQIHLCELEANGFQRFAADQRARVARGFRRPNGSAESKAKRGGVA